MAEPCVVCGSRGTREHQSLKLGRWWSCDRDVRDSHELRRMELEELDATPNDDNPEDTCHDHDRSSGSRSGSIRERRRPA